MTLKLAEKQEIVAALANVVNGSVAAVVAEYRGLTVEQMTEFRAKSRAAGVIIQVVRNTLARRAVADTDFACLQEVLVGPVILIFSQEDPGVGARVVRDFAKENEALQVKALVLSGQLLEASQLKAVADLPTRERALSMLLAVMKAPASKLVRTLSESYSQAVRVLAAIAEKKK